ncbi:arginine--tRNA ligase [Effusibacillus lacus]|uniref:Arginine--tRNA ligase n=1 Tax=Effusibacillus lacus TaxID=1348429 RepID=A0A292YJQ5_9BACL|nr:arginine--tRNA ligase [Effusibacillus lacus]TCS74266.1 arginyl-tRNA synthetase [Effusibacillus lacus]GAX88725.1 arginine--tRNA ligase [Effusibacillus lacus]
MYRQQLMEQLKRFVELEDSQLLGLIEIPKEESHGDLAFPCFQLAKQFRKAPNLIAAELADKVNADLLPVFEKAVAVGGYLNFFLNRDAVIRDILATIAKAGNTYGNSSVGRGQKVAIDMSSVNIAKPFAIHHLRSTMIGNAIANILDSQGYHVMKINHLGDWGTSFGKLIVAYRNWGHEYDLKDNAVRQLLELYVRFNQEAEKRPEMEDEARAAFKALEDGDEETVRLWKRFIEISLAEFEKTYRLLNVEFDYYLGESFYSDKMGAVEEELAEKGLLQTSEGAEIVDLSAFDMPPCLIRKSDGATLYATRDLATALYRRREMGADLLVYVVGAEQKLHFRQVFKVLELMGHEWAAKDCIHVPFGTMFVDGQRLSSRKGQVVFLEDVLRKAVEVAAGIIEEKNPALPNKEEVAEAVGVGAIIFNDLKNNRVNDVNFVWAEALNFDGETGPYVQYTYARISSLLRKGDYQPDQKLPDTMSAVGGDVEWSLVKLLGRFPNVLDRAREQYDPSVVAKYVIDVCQIFNRYYNTTRILEGERNEIVQKLTLASAARTVIGKCLHLLGLRSMETI